MLCVIVIEMQNCNNFDQVTILVGRTRNIVGQIILNYLSSGDFLEDLTPEPASRIY